MAVNLEEGWGGGEGDWGEWEGRKGEELEGDDEGRGEMSGEGGLAGNEEDGRLRSTARTRPEGSSKKSKEMWSDIKVCNMFGLSREKKNLVSSILTFMEMITLCSASR